MPRSGKGHKFILCIINEETDYLITFPMCQSKAEEVGEALIEHIITKYCIPRLYNNASGQHIHILPCELFI